MCHEQSKGALGRSDEVKAVKDLREYIGINGVAVAESRGH